MTENSSNESFQPASGMFQTSIHRLSDLFYAQGARKYVHYVQMLALSWG